MVFIQGSNKLELNENGWHNNKYTCRRLLFWEEGRRRVTSLTEFCCLSASRLSVSSCSSLDLLESCSLSDESESCSDDFSCASVAASRLDVNKSCKQSRTQHQGNVNAREETHNLVIRDKPILPPTLSNVCTTFTTRHVCTFCLHGYYAVP